MEVYLAYNTQQSGPHTEGKVQAMVAAQEIDRTCLAWREGLSGWRPLEEVVTLSACPPQGSFPVGLPPVPAHVTKNTGIKSAFHDLEKRLAATTISPLVERFASKAVPFIGLILIVVLKLACHHSR